MTKFKVTYLRLRIGIALAVLDADFQKSQSHTDLETVGVPFFLKLREKFIAFLISHNSRLARFLFFSLDFEMLYSQCKCCILKAI